MSHERNEYSPERQAVVDEDVCLWCFQQIDYDLVDPFFYECPVCENPIVTIEDALVCPFCDEAHDVPDPPGAPFRCEKCGKEI